MGQVKAKSWMRTAARMKLGTETPRVAPTIMV